MNLKDLWLKILEDLSTQIKRADLIIWFKNTAALSLEGGDLKVGLPLPMYLSWHERRFKELTLKSAQKIDPSITSIAYEVDITLNEKDERVMNVLAHFPEAKSRKIPGKAEMKIGGGLISKMFNPRYGFDNFVIAPQNRLAHAAAKAVAQCPGENYNPLFIHGGVGLGKTHLLQAIGSEIQKNDPSKVVLYTTTESFANEVIDAMQKRSMDSIRNKYRKVDVLIVDDIQFLANKDRTEEEFFHTFNALFDAGKQIIISSDQPPHALTLISERLRSRFEAGMTVNIKMPDAESRLAILTDRCQRAQVLISRDVLEFIAHHVDHSVRALEGVLKQTVAQYELEKATPTVNSIKPLLDHYRNEMEVVSAIETVTAEPKSVTLNHLVDLVSRYYQIPRDEILSESRVKECLLPRQIVMYLAKTKLSLSLAKIGRELGNRNHTTVIHGISKMAEQLKQDAQLLRDLNAITKEAGLSQII